MTLGIVWPERLAVILNISRKLYYTMFNRNALKFLWHCVIVLIVYVIGNRVLECPKWIWYLINKRPFDTAYLARSGWPLMWLIKLSTGSYKESPGVTAILSQISNLWCITVSKKKHSKGSIFSFKMTQCSHKGTQKLFSKTITLNRNCN